MLQSGLKDLGIHQEKLHYTNCCIHSSFKSAKHDDSAGSGNMKSQVGTSTEHESLEMTARWAVEDWTVTQHTHDECKLEIISDLTDANS